MVTWNANKSNSTDHGAEPVIFDRTFMGVHVAFRVALKLQEEFQVDNNRELPIGSPKNYNLKKKKILIFTELIEPCSVAPSFGIAWAVDETIPLAYLFIFHIINYIYNKDMFAGETAHQIICKLGDCLSSALIF